MLLPHKGVLKTLTSPEGWQRHCPLYVEGHTTGAWLILHGELSSHPRDGDERGRTFCVGEKIFLRASERDLQVERPVCSCISYDVYF